MKAANSGKLAVDRAQKPVFEEPLSLRQKSENVSDLQNKNCNANDTEFGEKYSLYLQRLKSAPSKNCLFEKMGKHQLL